MTIKKHFSSLTAIVGTALFVFCLARGQGVAEESRRYLSLCADRVVPSLFVFSVTGTLITSGGGFFDLCARLPFWGIEAGALVLGLIGGVPTGPMLAWELYKGGSISKRQAEYICAFSTTPSLSFIINYAGNAAGNARHGVFLAFAALCAALTTAFIFRPLMLKGNERPIRLSSVMEKSNRRGLSTIIGDCGMGMVTCSACVVFFGSIGAGLPAAVRGMLELCSGLDGCRDIRVAAFLTGFSGLSILCQAGAVTKGELDMMPLAAAKLFQGIFMGAAAFLLLD